MSRSFLSRPLVASLAVALMTMVVSAFPAVTWAGPGYQLDAGKPTIPLSGEVPVGVAIDQSSQVVYVAEVSRNLLSVEAGLIEQLSSTGVPTANSPFGTGGQDFFASVAVNPVTHGIYAYQIQGATPQGQKGEVRINTFSSTGVAGASFTPNNANAQAETLATDASGRLYFPNNVTGSVQIFSPSGTLESSISCAACPGGSFVTPQGVAIDSAGKVYVVDSANGGRVIRLSSSGVYEATLQSGRGAAAVAVDNSSGDVFVGAWQGAVYHVVAYDSSGVEFDDFGAGLATQSQIDIASGQLAVNATTHKVYLSNPGASNLWVFERIGSIPAPTASATAPGAVGQVEANLRATVNPKGHVLTSCSFEYTDHADFLANAYANAEAAPCPSPVGDREAVAVSATVKGLDPATSYDYRIKVASHGGSAESGNQSFQTLPALPPEATTGAASALTKTAATLGATVNPKGGTVSNCRFEYATEATFQSKGFDGSSAKACTTTPSGNANASVSAKVTGLAVGTAYRFRVVIVTNSGTAQAVEKTFSTVAETCAENPALCPITEPPPTLPPAQVEAGPIVTLPPPSTPAAKKPLKCRKGFKKKRVRGKPKCVRMKKHRRRR